MFVDLAADLDVPFATLSDATIARIDDALDPGLEAANPLDAWGTGIDADAIFREAFLAMADDGDVAALAFVVDLTEQGEPYAEGYLQISLDTAAATDKPFCVLSNLHSAIAPDEAAWLRERGIPILEGTESGLRALGHLLDDAAWRARPPVVAPDPVDADVRDRWRARLASGAAVGEAEALDLLADYGVPVVPVRAVTDAEARGRGRGGARLPRRTEDGRAGCPPQDRRRRGRAAPGRRRGGRRRLRDPGGPARSRGARRADGPTGGRDRARDRPRPDVRSARPRGGGRGPRGAAPRPPARAPAARRRGRSATDRRPPGPSPPRRCARGPRGRRAGARARGVASVGPRRRPGRPARRARREPRDRGSRRVRGGGRPRRAADADDAAALRQGPRRAPCAGASPARPRAVVR